MRRLHLREASTEGYVFTVPGGHPEGPGHILIPAAEVRRILGKGGQGGQVVGPSGVWVKPQPSEFLALLF